MVKSLFFKSKKTENVANLTASLAVVDLGRGRGQRQIYVCVARHAFIYFNGQSEPGPTGTPRKTDGTWIANTFSVVLVPRPNHGVQLSCFSTYQPANNRQAGKNSSLPMYVSHILITQQLASHHLVSYQISNLQITEFNTKVKLDVNSELCGSSTIDEK